MTENTVSTIGLKEAAQLANTNRNYLLKLLKAGKLPGELVARGETEIKEWRIPREAIVAWAEAKGTRTLRADGKAKHFIYLSDEERVQLAELGFEAVKVTYKTKTNTPAVVDEPNVASPDEPEHTADVPATPKVRSRKGKKISEAAAELFADAQ